MYRDVMLSVLLCVDAWGAAGFSRLVVGRKLGHTSLHSEHQFDILPAVDVNLGLNLVIETVGRI